MKTTKTVKFTKQDGRWYPIVTTGNEWIDQRGPGYTSKEKVREWAKQHNQFRNENIKVKFV